MAYQDLLNASIYKDLLGSDLSESISNVNTLSQDYVPINPYSSGAYTDRSARNIYTGVNRDIINPVQAMQDTGLSGLDKTLLGATQGLTFMNYASKASPFISQIAKSLGAKAPIGSLGPAALLYGATRNQNPYDFTDTERLGTIGSTALAAKSFAPILNPLLTKAIPTIAGKSAMGAAGTGIAGMHPALLVGGLLLGNFFSKKQKKKAKKAKKDAYADYRSQLQDVADERTAAVEENREAMQQAFLNQQYQDRYNQYKNQYGGNYRMSADKGMKMPANIVAEFTGNELVVNDQDALEQDLANGNVSRVASRIRNAMKGGKITPGSETHKSNPIPVDSEGNIYAKGGPLPFKVQKGAGIYDHATDQFKENMTDKEIAMVAKKNIAKWKKNNMA